MPYTLITRTEAIWFTNLRNLYWTSNKLYEYRTILLLTMRWLIKNLEAPNEEILAASAEYAKCCEDFKKIRNLLLKYQQGHDEKILYRVQKKLKLQYDHEKSALSKFLDHAFPLYVQQKTYENYKNRTQKQNGKVAEIRWEDEWYCWYCWQRSFSPDVGMFKNKQIF